MRYFYTICFFILFSHLQAQISSNYTGNGSDPTIWDDPDNWDNGVPGTNDEAVFDNSIAQAKPSIINTVSSIPTISRLFIKGSSSYELQLNIDLNITGKNIDDRAVQINAGQLTVGTGVNLSVAGPTGKDGIYFNNSNALLNNHGTIMVNVVDDDGINFNNGGTFNNYANVTIDGSTNNQRLMLIGTGIMNNSGNFLMTGGKQFSRAQINTGGTFNNNVGAKYNIEDGRMFVKVGGTFTNNGLCLADINDPLRTEASGISTNNGFYKYSNSKNVFSSEVADPARTIMTRAVTDNGIDLNNSTDTNIDMGGGNMVDLAQASYEWFYSGESIGTSDASGSLTIADGTFASDPAIVTTTIQGETISISLSNFNASVLPVNYVSISAQSMPSSIMVKWQTASEVNNDYMAVERSTDGDNFVEIGRVAGAGNSNKIQSYEVEDQAPVQGVNYYRLRQVDFDGTITYSEVVAAEYKHSEINLAIFPTVTNGKVNLKLRGQISELFLVNQVGQQIAKYQINNNRIEKIDVSYLPSGIYYLSYQNGNSFTTKRFIKQ